MSTREQVVVGGVLVEILARVAPREAKNLSPENLSDELKRAFPGSTLVRAADVVRERVVELPVARFLHLVGCVREFLVREATPRKGMQQDTRQKLISCFASTANVIRTLTDRGTLARSALTSPISMPGEPPSHLDRIGQLVRTGHAESTPHWELPVSSNLFGAKIATYFYLAGEDLEIEESKRLEQVLPQLVAHDSDELIVYLGYGEHDRAAGKGSLPIYLDGRCDPYERVKAPIELSAGQFFVYDGVNPHYWFAPPNTIAFFASASASQTFRKPVAFKSERDSVPGGSYLLFAQHSRRKPKKNAKVRSVPVPASSDQERASYLLGKRLRRKRDSFGVSAKEIEKLRSSASGVTATVIGKIENDALSNVRLGLTAAYGEALDVPLTELIPREPAEPMDGWDLARMRQGEIPRSHDLITGTAASRPFAIVPHLVPLLDAPDEVAFCEGEADVVLLVWEGEIDVFVVPDPLLLALELAHDCVERPEELGFSFSENRLRISRSKIDRLKKRYLLYEQRVRARQALQFNAELPHAVVRANGSSAQVIAVTTRGDIHLPPAWVKGGSSTAPHATDR